MLTCCQSYTSGIKLSAKLLFLKKSIHMFLKRFNLLPLFSGGGGCQVSLLAHSAAVFPPCDYSSVSPDFDEFQPAVEKRFFVIVPSVKSVYFYSSMH